MSIYAGIEDRALRAAASAKDGRAVIAGRAYVLTFDPNEWVYSVRDESTGEQIVRLNTKSLASAKRALKEWLS